MRATTEECQQQREYHSRLFSGEVVPCLDVRVERICHLLILPQLWYRVVIKWHWTIRSYVISEYEDEKKSGRSQNFV